MTRYLNNRNVLWWERAMSSEVITLTVVTLANIILMCTIAVVHMGILLGKQ